MMSAGASARGATSAPASASRVSMPLSANAPRMTPSQRAARRASARCVPTRRPDGDSWLLQRCRDAQHVVERAVRTAVAGRLSAPERRILRCQDEATGGDSQAFSDRGDLGPGVDRVHTPRIDAAGSAGRLPSPALGIYPERPAEVGRCQPRAAALTSETTADGWLIIATCEFSISTPPLALLTAARCIVTPGNGRDVDSGGHVDGHRLRPL